MQYLEFFSNKRVFTSQDLFEYISQKDDVLKNIKNINSLTKNTLQTYLKKGYIRRVKKDLYCAVSLEHKGIIPSKFEIASNMTKNSFLGLYSAMEYYGYSNQVYNSVNVLCYKYKFNDVVFDNNRYLFKSTWSDVFVHEENNVRVTSLERTIVDLIDSIETYDEFEELISNLNLVPAINGDEIIDILRIRDKKILYNKVGHIISAFVDDYLLTNNHLKEMKKHITKSRQYLTKERFRMKKYVSDWHIYTYISNEGE